MKIFKKAFFGSFCSLGCLTSLISCQVQEEPKVNDLAPIEKPKLDNNTKAITEEPIDKEEPSVALKPAEPNSGQQSDSKKTNVPNTQSGNTNSMPNNSNQIQEKPNDNSSTTITLPLHKPLNDLNYNDDLNKILAGISLNSKVRRWPTGIKKQFSSNPTNPENIFKNLIIINNVDNSVLNNIYLVKYNDNQYFNSTTINDITGKIQFQLQIRQNNKISEIKEFSINNTYLKDNEIFGPEIFTTFQGDRKNTVINLRNKSGPNELHELIAPFYRLKEEFLDFEGPYKVKIFPFNDNVFRTLGILQVHMEMNFDNSEHNSIFSSSLKPIFFYGFKEQWNDQKLRINPNFHNEETPGVKYDINKVYNDLSTLEKDNVWDEYILKYHEKDQLKNPLKKENTPSTLFQGLFHIYVSFIKQAVSVNSSNFTSIRPNYQYLKFILKTINLISDEKTKKQSILLQFQLKNNLSNEIIPDKTLNISVETI